MTTDQDAVTRVERTKSQARESYNRMSRYYDRLSGSSEKPHRQAGLRQLGLQPGEAVLEIGFGTGQALIEIGRLVGDAGQVTGVDISEGMAQVARERVHRAGLVNCVNLSLGDAASLPFQGSAFSAIFMSFTLELFDTPEIPKVLNECKRVMKAGGRLGVVSMERGQDPGVPVRLYEWVHRQIPAWVDCRPIHARQSLEQAGFQIRSFEVRSMWGLPVAVVLAEKTRPGY